MITLLMLRSGECLHKFHDEGCVVGTALDTSSRHLATGSSSGVVNLYSIAGITRLEDNRPPWGYFMFYFLTLSTKKFLHWAFMFFGGSYAILIFKKLFLNEF